MMLKMQQETSVIALNFNEVRFLDFFLRAMGFCSHGLEFLTFVRLSRVNLGWYFMFEQC